MNERDTYLESVNSRGLLLLALHLPAMCAVALYFGSSIGLAAALSVLFLAGPAAMFYNGRDSKTTSVSLGVSAMCFSALLIHLSGGMIEMHFHIFTMLALMIAFRFAWPLLVAAATIAIHHVAFFVWLPSSLFNYKATWGIVFLHAFFVVFEVIPAVWLTGLLAKSFAAQQVANQKLTATAQRVAEAASKYSTASRSAAGSASRGATMLVTARATI